MVRGRDIRAQQFMNQFQTEPQIQEQGAVGGQPPQGIPVNPVGVHPPQGAPPVNAVNPPLNPANPANFQIVNEYNSFNLANITPPIAPRWKQPDSLLDEFRKFKRSCLRIFDGPMCHITSGKVKTKHAVDLGQTRW